MWKCLRILLWAAPAIFSYQLYAQDCSTEKVNNNCTLTIDRAYPMGIPAIQMRSGQVITVKVLHRLPFEILTLDLQTGQAAAGTDQTAGFLTAALPQLKGLLVQEQFSAGSLGSSPPPNPNLTTPSVQDDQTELANIEKKLNDYAGLARIFDKNATIVYDQLNEVVGPLPPGFIPQGPRLDSRVAADFPRPWIAAGYTQWVRSIRCEISGQDCPADRAPAPEADPCTGTNPPVIGLLSCGSSLVTALAPCPSQFDPSNVSDVEQVPVACRITMLSQNIDQLSAVDKKNFPDSMQKLNGYFVSLNAIAAAISNVNKELSTYYSNLILVGQPHCSEFVGLIVDAHDANVNRNQQLPKFLGRQVMFSVNAVNEVATPATSVVTAAQKKSIVTITVVYADPKFEVSSGAIISTMPNRSFANQTIVTQNARGSSPAQGDVVITQTVANPTVVLFAGANWRLGRDFLWPDQRRGAVYLTSTIGLNANNTNVEVGAGPSLSWRSIMFSVLYDWGHDVRLTQGEYVGMIWCNQSTATSSVSKCTGSPPSPSTEKYWRGVVAFGISVRIPSVFGGATNSVSNSH